MSIDKPAETNNMEGSIAENSQVAANGDAISGASEEYLVSPESDVTPVLSIVMPTLNEEEGIEECINKAKSAISELSITAEIVISDSSTDRTPEIARSLGARVIEPPGKGYGYAYRYAFEQTRGDIIAMGDADTTYNFEELPKLYELVAEDDADMAMGSRLEGEIRPGAMPPLHQYVGNPLLTRFLNVFYGAGVSDAHSGMRVFTREAWEKMNCTSDGMEFASEMIMEAGARDLEIAELPITYHERVGEATLESFQDGWRHVRFMLVNAPGYLFSVPGIVLGVTGLLIMLGAFLEVGVGQISFGVRSMIAGSLLVLVGYQVASMGVFATIAGNPIRKPTDIMTRVIVNHLSLERGTTFGLAVFTVGAAYASYMIVEWITIGYVSSRVIGDIFALTLIVVGLQTVFGSFFMSSIAQRE